MRFLITVELNWNNAKEYIFTITISRLLTEPKEIILGQYTESLPIRVYRSEKMLFSLSCAGTVDPSSAVEAWDSEKNDYTYSSQTCYGVCGHYTQV